MLGNRSFLATFIARWLRAAIAVALLLSLFGLWRSASADSAAPPAAATQVPGSLAYLSGGNVWLLRDGGAPTKLTTSGQVTAVRWTPGGTWLRIDDGGTPAMLRTDGTIAAPLLGAWSSDDAVVAVASNDGIDLVRPLSTVIAHLLPPQSGVHFQPVSWSPDGAILALDRLALNEKGVLVSRSVWLVDRDGQHPRQLVPAGTTWPRAVGWSPDGRWLSVVNGPDEACVSCLVDGQRLDVVAVDGTRVYTLGTAVQLDWITWSPDSSSIMATVGGGREVYRNKHLVRLDLGSGALTSVDLGPQAVGLQPAWSPDGNEISFTRGQALAGDPFTNLDQAQSYLDVMSSRRLTLLTAGGSAPQPLVPTETWAEEASSWVDANTVLFVRWHAGKQSQIDQAQIWLANTSTGSTTMVVASLDAPDSSFGYYGYLGWEHRFSWHP